MVRPYALLRAGFGYYKTLGMRRVTSSPVDLALGNDGRIFIVGRSGIGQGIRIINWEDDNLGVFGGGDLQWPAAMVIDRDQKLYVSDEATDKICVFTTEGEGGDRKSVV